MKELIWTNTALEDIEQIRKNIEKDSIIYADRYSKILVSKITLLRKNSELGKPLELEKRYDGMNLREKPIGNYSVIYLVEDYGIYIITIVHTARERKHIKKAIRNFIKERKSTRFSY